MAPKTIAKETPVSALYCSGLVTFNKKFLNWEFWANTLINRLNLDANQFKIDPSLDPDMIAFDSNKRIFSLGKTPTTLFDYFTLACSLRALFQQKNDLYSTDHYATAFDAHAFATGVCMDYLGVSCFPYQPSDARCQFMVYYVTGMCACEGFESNQELLTDSADVYVNM